MLFPSAAIFADIATFTAIANRPGPSIEAIAGTIVFPHLGDATNSANVYIMSLQRP